MRDWIQKHSTAFVGAGIAVATVVLSALAEFDPSNIVDWRMWAVGVGAASVRQAALSFLTYIGAR